MKLNKPVNQAFTLVEMLVVMVLLGLITSILFQGLNLIGKVQERLIPKIQQQQRNALQEKWFRETVSGLMAGVSATDMFVGTSAGFKGLSISPLHSPYSAPAMIQWTITNIGTQQTLNYQQAQSLQWKIQSVPVSQQSLTFSYLNQSGKWLEDWNVRGSDINQSLLPEAIAMKTYSQQQELWWIARINGEKQASWWLFGNE